jgi:CRISPR-associated protein Cst2
MPIVYTLSLCGRVILDLHNLNNEGTEGNQQMTRTVWVVVKDQERKPILRNVNAISGDMFKHIQAEHLHKLAIEQHSIAAARFPLSAGALAFDANRINSAADKLDAGFWGRMEHQVNAKVSEELTKPKRAEELSGIKVEKDRAKRIKEIRKEIIKSENLVKGNVDLMNEILKSCAVTDLEGTLVTAEVTGESRSLSRKSCIEFGWGVGLPDLTRTESLFHVKYDPRERGEGAGSDTPQQAIFYRPLNSGVYGIIAHVELFRVGRNDITLQYAVERDDRTLRAKALLESLWYTFVKTAGAQRNTQHPHVLGWEGTIAYSSILAVPAPTASPLEEDYAGQVEKSMNALNRLHPNSIRVLSFENQGDFGDKMGELIQQLEAPE